MKKNPASSTNDQIRKASQEVIGDIALNLADRLRRVDPEVVLTITIGSHAAAANLKDSVRPTWIAPGKETFRDHFKDKFTKDGDGFADVWGEKPPKLDFPQITESGRSK